MGSSSKRPNIVFIISDSMDGRVMGCMGHPAAATPSLDGLAERGVMFRNTYCNNPICCPSRASMWSGKYTHHCEGWNNHKGLEVGEPTFRTHLEAAGYRCRIVGKTDYLSGAHTIRARVTPWTRSAGLMLPTYVEPPPTVDDSDEPRCNAGDWKKVDECVDWLKGSAGDGPFVLYCGLHRPHPPFRTTRYWLDRIDPRKVAAPPADELQHPVMDYMRVQKNWQHGFSDEMTRLVRRVYLAMIAEVDAMVGELLEAVDALGLRGSTYVIYTSDHGEMAMEHQQYYKMVHYEASAHVPLLISGPGVRRGEAVERPASLVDIYPTLMDMAGAAHPGGLDGHSLMPELRGRPTGRPDWALSEFHGTTSLTGAFMLRRGQWKYIAYVGYPPLLFDLAEDPDELVNLAASRPDVAGQMDRKLREIVDYEAVDAKVKRYDKESFRRWRDEQIQAGTYRQLMGRIHSGWDRPSDNDAAAWDDEKEAQIRQWLAQ